MNRLALLLFLFLLHPVLQAQDSTHHTLDSLIADYLNTYEAPSLVMAYVQPNRLTYGIGGTTQIDAGQAAKLTDKYHIGSNTKAITSFVAFQLIEAGLISLDTKFIDLYPDWATQIKEEYLPITLGELLNHVAGIPPYTSGGEYKKLPDFVGTTAERRQQFAEYVLNQKPVKEGSYSNAGYVLAAMMLEKVKGQPFEAILKESLENMEIDGFYGFPNKQDINFPWGHQKEKGKLTALPPNHDYKLEEYVLPAGDLSLNIIDYAKFIQNYLPEKQQAGAPLSPSSYEQMLYAHDGYAYGWGNQINEKGKLAFHDGSAGTFYCHTIISTTHNFALIFIINSATDQQAKGLMELRSKVFRVRKSL